MTVVASLALPSNRRKQLRRTNAGSLAWQDAPRIFVDDYGAVGDGSTNDTAAIDLAMDAAYALATNTNKKVVLEFNGDKDYVIASRVSGQQRRGGVFLRRGVCIEGNGATLRLSTAVTANCAFIQFKFPTHSDKSETNTTNTSIAGDIAAGDVQITVTSTTGFAVGDEVFLRINDNAWDNVETKDPMHAKVLTVDDATHLTLDRPVPVAMSVAGTQARNRNVQLMHELIEGIFVRNVVLVSAGTGNANAEYGIYAGYARNCVFENIIAEHPGTGIVVGGYMHNCVARNLRLRKCVKQASHTAKGRGLNLWNAKGMLIDGLYAEDFEGTAAFMESYCRGTRYRNVHLVNTNTLRNNSSVALLTVGQGSNVSFDGITVEGKGGTALFDNGGTDAFVTVQDVVFNTTSQMKASGYLDQFSGSFMPSWMTEYHVVKRYSKRIWLKASTDATFAMPSGLYRIVRVYASAVTGITDFYMTYGATNGINLAANLSAAAEIRLSALEQYGSDYPFNNNTSHAARIVTDGTLAAGTYVTIDAEYYPSAVDDGSLGLAQDDTPMPLPYTPTNVTPDRAFDADTVLVAELADVVGTLIADLKTRGVLQ